MGKTKVTTRPSAGGQPDQLRKYNDKYVIVYDFEEVGT